MFKSIALLAVVAFAAVSAGIIETHAVVEPIVAKVGAVVHSVPSAVSSQSFTRIHNTAEVAHIVAPVQVAPVIKAVPLIKTVQVAPVVSHVQYGTPVVRAYAAAPVVHAAPIVHSAPILKTIVSPVAYAVHH